MNKISCIIPAYNEEKGIGNVLSIVVPLIGKNIYEVIVVDDYSNDGTKEIVKTFPDVNLIEHSVNQGKSKTVADGINNSKGDYIFMLDADLVGLREEDINALIYPIEKGIADVVLSIRKDSPKWMHYIQVDLMTGERIISKEMLLPHMVGMSKLPSYGLEVFLNRIFIKNKCRIVSVIFDNVYDEFQYKRRGFWHGIKRDFMMWVDIFRTVPVWEWVYQNFALGKLVVKN